MQIQINTDHNIKGTDALMTHLRSELESTLIRVSSHITRIEVHLSDENGVRKSNNDKRCVMEARLEGSRPIAVTHHATTLDQVFDEAGEKLARMIESTIGRLEDQRNQRNDLNQSEPEPSNE